MQKFAISKFLGLAALGALALISEPAKAGQIAVCTVQHVQVNNERIMVKCTQDAADFNVWGSGWNACNSRVSSDTFKVFASMAQSALLAGKPLLMNYNDIDNTCAVTTKAVTLMRISP